MTSKVMEQWLATAPDWALSAPSWLGELLYKLFKCFIFDQRYMLYVKGLGNTMLLTFYALLLGLALGVVVALVRVSWDKTHHQVTGPRKAVFFVMNRLCKLYLTVIRGTPVVVQLMILYFVVFAASKNKILVGAIAFGINSGAYVAEIIRGGIMSVDSGQMEAGRSLGFSYVPTMRFIILPQAFKNVLPALANEFIVLLKETAVVGYIGLGDVTYAGYIVAGNSYDYLFPLLLTAAIYLLLVIFITALIGRLERRLQSNER